MGASCSLVKKPVVSIEDNDTQPILGNNSCINLTTLNSGEVKPANVIDEIQTVEVLDDNNDPNHPVIFGVRNILEWKASIKIFRYHWWPMQEKQTYSVYNNLPPNAPSRVFRKKKLSPLRGERQTPRDSRN